MFGDHSELDPPDPIPNSEVKRFSVDGSVGSPHVRVEHRQAFIPINPKYCKVLGVFSLWQVKRRCSFSRGEIKTKRATCRRIPHVKALVPKVRGLGAEGIAQRLETCFQPIVEPTKRGACACINSLAKLLRCFVVQSIFFKQLSSHCLYLTSIAN